MLEAQNIGKLSKLSFKFSFRNVSLHLSREPQYLERRQRPERGFTLNMQSAEPPNSPAPSLSQHHTPQNSAEAQDNEYRILQYYTIVFCIHCLGRCREAGILLLPETFKSENAIIKVTIEYCCSCKGIMLLFTLPYSCNLLLY